VGLKETARRVSGGLWSSIWLAGNVLNRIVTSSSAITLRMSGSAAISASGIWWFWCWWSLILPRFILGKVSNLRCWWRGFLSSQRDFLGYRASLTTRLPMESSIYSIRIRPLYEESNPIVWTTFSYVSTSDRKTQETPASRFLLTSCSAFDKPWSKSVGVPELI